MVSLMFVLRSSQYAMIASPRGAAGKQVLAPDALIVLNCRVPLLEAFTLVYGVSYSI